jgi:hypothetical protein
MSYIHYLVDSIKLQSVDTEAWIVQTAVIASLLSLFWAPLWFV